MSFDKPIHPVAVVGAGVIGASWATQYLARGFEANLRKRVDDAWRRLKVIGLSAVRSQDRPSSTPRMEDTLPTDDFLQESGAERPDLKTRLYDHVDAAAPVDSINASSSSSLTRSVIQSKRQRPERCLIGHPFQMQLAHANRIAAMGQLTASIAHEVNQPIAATVANAQAALRWLGAEPPNLDEVYQALGRIVRDGNRAAAVVGRIRAHIKGEPRRDERVDINAAIREVVEITRSEAMKYGALVQTELVEGLLLVHGDWVELQQVILNLILNALEAMSEMSDGSLELQITADKTESGDVLVAVRDSGPGLVPTTLEHLFKAFHTTKPNGLGLGLSICRSIIESHGGRLWAGANAPRGAVFQFTLPAHRDSVV